MHDTPTVAALWRALPPLATTFARDQGLFKFRVLHALVPWAHVLFEAAPPPVPALMRVLGTAWPWHLRTGLRTVLSNRVGTVTPTCALAP